MGAVETLECPLVATGGACDQQLLLVHLCHGIAQLQVWMRIAAKGFEWLSPGAWIAAMRRE